MTDTEKQATLNIALLRYKQMLGLEACGNDLAQAVYDRAMNPEMLRHFRDGSPIFQEDDCVRFMEGVTGISADECRQHLGRIHVEINMNAVIEAARSASVRATLPIAL